jgi:hypothetical protein
MNFYFLFFGTIDGPKHEKMNQTCSLQQNKKSKQNIILGQGWEKKNMVYFKLQNKV